MKNRYKVLCLMLCMIFLLAGCKKEANLVSISITSSTGGSVNPTTVLEKPGEKVTIQATPEADYIFDGWYIGNKKVFSQMTYQFEVTKETTEITAKFTKKSALSLSISEDSIKEAYLGYFELANLQIEVKYNNETKSTHTVTESMVTSGLDQLDTVGIHTLTIAYQGCTTTVNIEILPLHQGTDGLVFERLSHQDGYKVTGYTGSDTFVVIPDTYLGDPVLEIGSRSFLNNKTIQKVTLSSSVEIVREGAFYGCSFLHSIVLPEEVRQIETHALYDVKIIYMESSSIPTSWPDDWYNSQKTYIHTNINLDTIAMFEDFEYFISDDKVIVSDYFGESTEIEIPSLIEGMPVEKVGGACLKENEIVTKIIVSEGIKELSPYAFASCTQLVTLILPSTLITIGECAIRGCESIVALELPSSLKEIGGNAFNMCTNLQELVIPRGVEKIGSYAFSWCTGLVKLYIPNTVVIIEGGACYSCGKATIYTEFLNEPTTWVSGWNMSNRPIQWGAVMPE